MFRFSQLAKALRRNRRGAAARECTLLAGAIAFTSIGAIHTLGTAVNRVLTDISGAAW
jgi:Flp pilus assembly pilin Flp